MRTHVGLTSCQTPSPCVNPCQRYPLQTRSSLLLQRNRRFILLFILKPRIPVPGASNKLGEWVIEWLINERRSVAKTLDVFSGVCLWVCVFVNTTTSERVNIGRWNLGWICTVPNLSRVRIWGHSPLGARPPKCDVRLRHWENQFQRRLSSWVCDFSPCARSATGAAKETEFGAKIAYGMGMMSELRIHA